VSQIDLEVTNTQSQLPICRLFVDLGQYTQVPENLIVSQVASEKISDHSTNEDQATRNFRTQNPYLLSSFQKISADRSGETSPASSLLRNHPVRNHPVQPASEKMSLQTWLERNDLGDYTSNFIQELGLTQLDELKSVTSEQLDDVDIPFPRQTRFFQAVKELDSPTTPTMGTAPPWGQHTLVTDTAEAPNLQPDQSVVSIGVSPEPAAVQVHVDEEPNGVSTSY